MLLRFVLSLLFFTTSFAAFGEREHRQPHHFFNAKLLDPYDHQISMVGNYKYGFSDTLELGTQGLFLLGRGLNLSLKHQMFSGPSYQTSFTSHTLYFSNESTRDHSEKGTKTKVSTTVFASALGIVTSSQLQRNGYLNWGLLDYFILYATSDDNIELNVHIISPLVGYDYVMNPSFSLSAVLAYPALMIGHLESDFADADIMLNLIQGIPPGINPSLMFLTGTYTDGNFNVEGGLMFIGKFSFPYVNLFWRFQ